MPTFISKTYKSMINPLLKKAGLKTSAPSTGENTMGAILRFVLINAASVIGAKLINEVVERASEKIAKDRTPDMPTQTATAPKALETKYCKKCGAFVIKGETCDCT